MEIISDDKIFRLNSMLAEASSIVIVTHTKPDGDAMGSSIAMLHTLTLYGKQGNIVIANHYSSNLDFLTEDIREHIIIHEDKMKEAEMAIRESDLVICLDFNAFHRTDALETSLRESRAAKILIDHHLSPDTGSFALVFSKTDISSASELLYSILMELPPVRHEVRNLPAKAATALMTGMTTDTNNFANSVYPSTLAMASSLLQAGVDREMILQNIYNSFKESRIRLMGLLLKDIMKITPDGVAYMILDRKTMYTYNVEEGDTEGFVNIPLSIRNVKMSILIKEDNGMARVSIRSRRGVSANRCARLYFNGGGHENAAGGRLYIPKDISEIGQAEKYIECTTHIFMNENNE